MGLFKKAKQENDLNFFIKEVAGKWPNEEFVQIGTDKNSSGQEIKVFKGVFKTPYFWVFDIIEIREFEGTPNKNIIFRTSKRTDINHLKKLVNEVFRHYGKDDDGEGKLTSKDQKDIAADYWLGRKWLGEKFKHPVILGYDEVGGIQFTIFYVGK